MPQKQGKIIPNGVSLQKHENDTVVFFTERGFDVELIPASHTPGRHTPDLMMVGIRWEVKNPIKSKRTTIIHAFHSATKQSPNIVFDLRHIKKSPDRPISFLKHLFLTSQQTRRLIIIQKNGQILDFSK